MGKMPRFEDGKPLSASKLNKLSEAIEESTTYWKAEAERAFAERDAAKRRLREAVPSVAAEEWRKQFFKDIELPEVMPTSVDFFLGLLESVEKENKTITRIDVPAELLRALRGFGRTVFDSATGWFFRDTGLVGTLNLITPVDIYLNNALGGKARLYLEKVGYREYEFPAELAQPNGEKIVDRAIPNYGTPCVKLTVLEQIMYEILRDLVDQGLALTVQCQFALGKYRADFAIPQIKLAIE